MEGDAHGDEPLDAGVAAAGLWTCVCFGGGREMDQPTFISSHLQFDHTNGGASSLPNHGLGRHEPAHGVPHDDGVPQVLGRQELREFLFVR